MYTIFKNLLSWQRILFSTLFVCNFMQFNFQCIWWVSCRKFMFDGAVQKSPHNPCDSWRGKTANYSLKLHSWNHPELVLFKNIKHTSNIQANIEHFDDKFSHLLILWEFLNYIMEAMTDYRICKGKQHTIHWIFWQIAGILPHRNVNEIVRKCRSN